MTIAVPAPTRRALARALGLAVGLSSWSHEVAAAPESEPPPEYKPPPDSFAPIDPLPPPEPLPTAPEIATPEPEGPEPEESEPEESEESDLEEPAPDDAAMTPVRPPRFDGPYVGGLVMGTANFGHVKDLATPNPLIGTGGFLQAGDAIFPWMSIGIAIGGQAGWYGKQQMFQGALLVEFGWVPAKRYPLSFRTGFGFGGGAVTEQGIARRFGYGGALFKGSVRYEFFPLAARKRPDRGGGWAIGPELGWLGATPAAKGQPFMMTILLGISTSFYFGS